MMGAEDHRLDRIEQKLDRLAETVAQIVRVEEQLTSAFKRLDRHEKRLDDQEDDIRELTEDAIMNAKSVRNSERLFWIIISIIMSGSIYLSTTGVAP
jgi:ABC-type transporter Mla subunit MlaD